MAMVAFNVCPQYPPGNILWADAENVLFTKTVEEIKKEADFGF